MSDIATDAGRRDRPHETSGGAVHRQASSTTCPVHSVRGGHPRRRRAASGREHPAAAPDPRPRATGRRRRHHRRRPRQAVGGARGRRARPWAALRLPPDVGHRPTSRSARRSSCSARPASTSRRRARRPTCRAATSSQGRWTFQLVEEYDDGYYARFKDHERRAREELAGGTRHIFEAEMKASRDHTRSSRSRAGAGRRRDRTGGGDRAGVEPRRRSVSGTHDPHADHRDGDRHDELERGAVAEHEAGDAPERRQQRHPEQDRARRPSAGCSTAGGRRRAVRSPKRCRNVGAEQERRPTASSSSAPPRRPGGPTRRARRTVARTGP